MEDDEQAPAPGGFHVVGETGAVLGVVDCPAHVGLRAETYDAEAHEVDCVLYTGAAVDRMGPRGPYRMRIDVAGIDLSRVTGGPNGRSAVPLALEHMPWIDFDGVLGMLIAARVEAGRLVGRVRLHADAEAAAVRERIQNGTYTSLSIGIAILERVEIEDDVAGALTVVTRSRLLEVSLTGDPADAGAGFLTGQGARRPPAANASTARRNLSMEDEELNGAAAGTPPATPPAAPTPPHAAAAPPSQPTPGQEATQLSQQLQARDRELATANERLRQHDVREVAAAFGLSDRADEWVRDPSVTVTVARQRAQEVFASRQREETAPTAPHASARAAGGLYEDRLTAMREGLALRQRLTPADQATDMARDYEHVRLADMARQLLEGQGRSTRRMSDDMVVSEVLSGAHTTSDFPLLLGDIMQRTLQASYDAAPTVYQQIARRNDHNNFHPSTRITLGQVPGVQRLGENGEIRAGTFGEKGEVVQLDEFGRMLTISRRSIVNDDLGAFTQLPQLWGQSIAQFEEGEVIGRLVANANLSDGNALFSSAHANLLAAAGMTEAAMDLAVELMMSQRGHGDEAAGEERRYISIMPSIILTGPKRRAAARRLVNGQVVPTKSSEVPIYADGSLTVLSTPQLIPESGNEPWFLLTSPQSPGCVLEYGYLTGRSGPLIEFSQQFTSTGVSYRIVHDFASGVVDHVGAVKNPGNA
ncbi:MAG: hypothetical protein AAFR84_06590 [Pseudomonadota bacterium]